jgi:hypothetical protein
VRKMYMDRLAACRENILKHKGEMGIMRKKGVVIHKEMEDQREEVCYLLFSSDVFFLTNSISFLPSLSILLSLDLFLLLFFFSFSLFLFIFTILLHLPVHFLFILSISPPSSSSQLSSSTSALLHCCIALFFVHSTMYIQLSSHRPLQTPPHHT